MAGTKDWFVYIKDEGTKCSILTSTYYGTLPALGFEPLTSKVPTPSKRFHPRHITVVHPQDRRSREVPCGSLAASAWTTDTVIPLQDVGVKGTTDWTIVERHKEREGVVRQTKSRDWFVYTTSEGQRYRMLVSTYYGNLPALGFEPADPSVPELPRGFRPRQVNVASMKDGRYRQIPCGSTKASVWNKPGVIELQEGGVGEAVTWSITSFSPEQRRMIPRRIHPEDGEV